MADIVEDVEVALTLNLVQTHIDGDEGASAPHTSTAEGGGNAYTVLYTV